MRLLSVVAGIRKAARPLSAPVTHAAQAHVVGEERHRSREHARVRDGRVTTLRSAPSVQPVSS